MPNHATRRTALAGAALLSALPLVALSLPAHAQADAGVVAAVEALRVAMLAGDRAKLNALTADQLSYGHSGGRVETKAQFVETIAGGRGTFNAIQLSEQTVSVVGDVAVVRHSFRGEAVTDGKAEPVNIKVLQVWRQSGGTWTLLARQAIKA